jgi:hypothetical protein
MYICVIHNMHMFIYTLICIHNPYTEEELGIYMDIYKYSLRYA